MAFWVRNGWISPPVVNIDEQLVDGRVPSLEGRDAQFCPDGDVLVCRYPEMSHGYWRWCLGQLVVCPPLHSCGRKSHVSERQNRVTWPTEIRGGDPGKNAEGHQGTFTYIRCVIDIIPCKITQHVFTDCGALPGKASPGS